LEKTDVSSFLLLELTSDLKETGVSCFDLGKENGRFLLFERKQRQKNREKRGTKKERLGRQ
jgi:hypothetical protein